MLKLEETSNLVLNKTKAIRKLERRHYLVLFLSNYSLQKSNYSLLLGFKHLKVFLLLDKSAIVTTVVFSIFIQYLYGIFEGKHLQLVTYHLLESDTDLIVQPGHVAFKVPDPFYW